MKVSLKLISDTEQEEAKLYVHKETDSIKRLEAYISEDGFSSRLFIVSEGKGANSRKIGGNLFILKPYRKFSMCIRKKRFTR